MSEKDDEFQSGLPLMTFQQIPLYAAFYDETGCKWRKVEEDLAVRTSDGAHFPVLSDAVFRVNEKG